MSKKDKLENMKRIYAEIRHDYFHGFVRDRKQAANKYSGEAKQKELFFKQEKTGQEVVIENPC
jgi:hypothetical protein